MTSPYLFFFPVRAGAGGSSSFLAGAMNAWRRLHVALQNAADESDDNFRLFAAVIGAPNSELMAKGFRHTKVERNERFVNGFWFGNMVSPLGHSMNVKRMPLFRQINSGSNVLTQ